MTPAERSARLALVQTNADLAPPPGVGGWRYRVVGGELQLRNRRLPHLRLDLLKSEADDLAHTLAIALGEALAMPVVKVSWWARLGDWFARLTWKRRHSEEQRLAIAKLAEEFKQNGGWV